MTAINIVCSSPNHAGRSAEVDWQAVLGTADRQVTGMLCGACVRLDPPDPVVANIGTLQQRAVNALSANDTFLAIASPTNAQTLAQVQRLTKECNALIRLTMSQLADISDTA